jgi:glycosyl transferase family 87
MKPRIWLALSLFAAIIASLYAVRILGPWGQYVGQLHDGIKMQMGDLYSPWVGARELLLRRRNPYAPEVSHEIQIAFYGHAINQTYQPGAAVVNEQRFAYPIYAVVLLAPTIYFDFADVRRGAWWVLGLLTAASVLLCLDLLRQRLPWETTTALVLFTLSSPQVLQGLRFEQLALVVAFLLIAGCWCVSKHHLIAASALFAFSTIKPQMALLPLCWFAIWVAGDWHNRWRLAAGFIAVTAALFATGELLLPGWFGYFLSGLAAYRKYAPPTSLLRVALGDIFGKIVAGAIVLGLLIFAWRNRKLAADSRQFTTIFAAFLIGSILVLPLLTPFNQVMLILPALLLLQGWKTLPRLSRLVFMAIVSWPWIASTTLLIFRPRLDSLSQLPLLPSFLVLFFPVFLPLLLMTRRRLSPSQFPAADLHSS